MLYATIELIDNKVALVRAKTKSGRLLPNDIDTTTIDQAMTDILKFVQAQEPTEVEEALQIKDQAKKEAEEAKRKEEEARREQARLQAELESMKRDMEESYVLKETVDETVEDLLTE